MCSSYENWDLELLVELLWQKRDAKKRQYAVGSTYYKKWAVDEKSRLRYNSFFFKNLRSQAIFTEILKKNYAQSRKPRRHTKKKSSSIPIDQSADQRSFPGFEGGRGGDEPQTLASEQDSSQVLAVANCVLLSKY